MKDWRIQQTLFRVCVQKLPYGLVFLGYSAYIAIVCIRMLKVRTERDKVSSTVTKCRLVEQMVTKDDQTMQVAKHIMQIISFVARSVTVKDIKLRDSCMHCSSRTPRLGRNHVGKYHHYITTMYLQLATAAACFFLYIRQKCGPQHVPGTDDQVESNRGWLGEHGGRGLEFGLMIEKHTDLPRINDSDVCS